LITSQHPVYFFKRLFPEANLIKGDSMNRSLAGAVETALRERSWGSHVPMDVTLTRFQWQVLEAIAAIPFGHTRTYGAVASTIGRPLGARAVGQVMARNPLPIIFP